MQTTYEATYIHKTSEKDDFNEGCTGECHNVSYQHTISAQTKIEFLQQFADHVGVSVEDVQVDPCGDDPCRVEAQTLEGGEVIN